MVKLSNEGNKIFKCKKGKAFCQGIFHEYFVAEGNEDPELTRNGGIGSTDKQ
jgi:dUTPase